jgi:small redox-active disulfide protein 2
MDIKVLGSGCANCKNTMALIEQVAREKGVAVTLGKVEEMREIVGYGVMSTPGVVIDGQVVHAGGVPGRAKVEQWLTAGAPASAAGPGACCAPASAGGGRCCG